MFHKDGRMSEILNESFVGIDVSKSSLDVFVDPPVTSVPRQLAYDDTALVALGDALTLLSPALVVIEATAASSTP
jgi:hypothetical protein